MFKTALAALAIAAGLTVPVASAETAHHGKPDIPFWVVKPCATTLSINCRWTPPKGYDGPDEWMHTSIRRHVPGANGITCVFYVEKSYAKDHDYCA